MGNFGTSWIFEWETSLLDGQLTAPNRRSTETILCFAALIVWLIISVLIAVLFYDIYELFLF